MQSNKPLESTRRDTVECPYCGEPTMPNDMRDGTVVCSCPAERDLTPRAPDAKPDFGSR